MTTTTPGPRLETVLNFRDVGATVNKFLGRKLVREGLLFRAARPDWATEADRTLMVQELGIRSIVDLRTKSEQLKEVEKHNLKQPLKPAIAQTKPEVMQDIRMPGIDYHDLGLIGWPFQQWMAKQLPWGAYICFLALFLFGFRTRATRLITAYVLGPLGLIGMSAAMLDVSGNELAQVLRTYTQPAGLPSLVHCSFGKDRTGLVVVLVLMILGVPLDAARHDYGLTDGAFESEREERLLEIRSAGFSDEWFYTAPGLVDAMQSHIDARYGGVAGYMDNIGFTEGERNTLREKLLY